MQIVPAILRDSVEEFEQSLQAFRALAPVLHVDVADGTLTASRTLAPVEVPVAPGVQYSWHLMVADPTTYLADCLSRPTAEVYVHAEIGMDRLAPVVRQLTQRNVVTGIALNPETPVELIAPLLPQVQRALVLTVEPGAQGSPFVSAALTKIALLRQVAPHLKLAIDGSVNPHTLTKVVPYRPDMLVVGSYLWPGPDLADRWSTLQRALRP